MQDEKSILPIRDRVRELYAEIRQIYQQYLKEVPKKRRPWPESIKSRVLELWKLGVSSHQIAQETGLPAQTMYSWKERVKKSDSGFLPVPIVKKRHRRSNFDTQLSQLESEVKSTTVTVVTPDGFRIEGIMSSDVARILREMKKSRACIFAQDIEFSSSMSMWTCVRDLIACPWSRVKR